MQRRRSRHVVATTTALVLFVAACGKQNDVLGPTEPIWQQQAFHFDTFYTNITAAAAGPDSAMQIAIANLIALNGETPPGYGAKATPVAVTTGAGAQTWQGWTFEVANTGAGGDSSFMTFLFNTPAASEIIIATTNYDAGGDEGGLATVILNQASADTDSVYTGSATLGGTTTAGCSLLSGLNAGGYISGILGAYACQPATFQVTFQATFAAADSLGTVSISNAPFTGVRLSAPVSNGGQVVRIPTRAAAVGMELARLAAHLRRRH
jgi:hypothetical protein